jgi:HK97 family phage major capsid protein
MPQKKHHMMERPMFDEIKGLIKEGNEVIADVAKRVGDLEARVGDIETRLDEGETKANRPGAFSTKSDLATEAKQLRTFCETGEGLSRKDVDTATGANGGYALPKQISNVIQDQLINVSPIRQIARVIQVQSSDYRHLVGVRGATTAWNNELATRAATDSPLMAEVVPTFGELWAFPSITQHALDDLLADPEGWVQTNVSDAFGQAEGAAFVSGNGTDKPTGFLTGTPVATGDATRAFGVLQYIPTGDASTLGTSPADKLVDLIYTLKAGYRTNGRFVMNSKTAGTVRKLKDAEGRFLWSDSLASGEPSLLLGYPVTIAEDMPDIGAGTFPIAFGDFQRGYIICDRVGVRIIRDEVTKPGWVNYLISKRVGGKLADSSAIKLLRVAAS